MATANRVHELAQLIRRVTGQASMRGMGFLFPSATAGSPLTASEDGIA